MAAITVDEIQVLISAQTKGIQKEINGVKEQLGSLSEESQKVSSGFGGMLKSVAKFAILTVGIKKAVDFLKSSVTEAKKSSQKNLRLSAIMILA